ncbi:MAG: aspartate carbamoyltransferase catalytic subunit [Planctomycetes bacterium]|nr:aspartate carbamoyltransferase catalytic subunit [Planctomycetota bacterium]MCB9890715.1 aspartate carbamoyltransferase catalytic subunit [Planctomycetota bacterium]MCB9920062.1 aspartate carbamoyltransferase catalytic subunit [Planctomycetota bacterium]
MVAKRDFVSADDLSASEILALFRVADRYEADLRAHSGQCPGTILATLFFEPSTRTRLSFESAMLRLGGGVISASEAGSTSATKGESLADTVRVVGGRYSDIIVLRHPFEGAARVAARYASVPVVNAGDGAHEHPTQTLCDLYTLWRQKGKLDGLEVLLAGDLKYSRTIHSLAYALARFGSNLVFQPFPGLEIPESVLVRLERDFSVDVRRARAFDIKGLGAGKDAVYVTPHKPHQNTLFTKIDDEEIDRIDAIYMTRLQRERLEGNEDPTRTDRYPSLDPAQFQGKRFKDMGLMHPLPRVDEISYEFDDDPRALYFRQATLGVPIRMALLAFLLGRLELDAERPAAYRSGRSSEPRERPVYRSAIGLRCKNPRCVTHAPHERYVVPEFLEIREAPPLLRCVFCDWEVEPALIGHAQSRRLHRSNAAEAQRIGAARRVYFEDEAQATAAGFGNA